MTDHIDLGPAAHRIGELAAAVRDDQLTARTPCTEYTVADLIDHLLGLSVAFRMAADKQPTPGNPPGDGDRLPPEWRTELATRATAMAEAWRDPRSRDGDATAGGITLPAEVMAIVALDELILHGWDLAKAIGADYSCSDAEANAIAEVLAQGDGDGSIFGAPVPVADDASALDRAVGLSGRDPRWRP